MRLWIAAYLGEVIRRETGGVWYELRRQSRARRRRTPGRSRCGGDAALRERQSRRIWRRHDRNHQAVLRDGSSGMQRQWLDRHGARHLRIDGGASHLDDAGRQAGRAAASRSRRPRCRPPKLKWTESLDFSADSLDAIERMLGKMHNLAEVRRARRGLQRRADHARPRSSGASTSARSFAVTTAASGRSARTASLSLALGEAQVTAHRQGPQAHRRRADRQHPLLLRGDR